MKRTDLKIPCHPHNIFYRRFILLLIAFSFLLVSYFRTPPTDESGGSISGYIAEYNNERPHSEHGGDYPAEFYRRAA